MRKPRTPNGVPGSDHGQKFHELFGPEDGVSPPDYRPEPIKSIFVTRFDTTGPVQALRPFSPVELTGNASIIQRFGGGTYLLTARREDGTIYTKRQITLPGPSKSMTGDDQPAQAQPGVAPAANGAPALPPTVVPGMMSGDPMQFLLAFMMQQNAQQQQQQLAQMTMLGQVMVAAISGKGSDAGEAAKLVAETMKSTIEMMKASIPPPAPQAVPLSPVSAVKEMLEVARMINPPPKPPPAPPALEERASDVIKALAEGIGPFVQMAVSASGAAKALAPAAPIAGPMG